MTEAQELHRLTENMARLTVLDHTRKDQTVIMPEAELVTEFEMLSCGIGGYSMYMDSNQLLKKLVTLFGAVPIVMTKVWELMHEHLQAEVHWPKYVEKKHLCWTLHKLKSYAEETTMAVTMKGADSKPDEKSFRKWTDFFIEEISELEPYVIKWENRLDNDANWDTKVGVDTTDSPFQQIKIPHPTKPGKKIVNKALYSYKLDGPGLRYEVGTAVATDHIVWINGPFSSGDYNDLTIFQLGLLNMLQPLERVLADQIYVSEAPNHVVCENMMGEMDADRQELIKRGCGCIENVMNQLKTFNCTTFKYRGRGPAEERIQKHGQMFRACAVLLQIAMDLGVQELYDV